MSRSCAGWGGSLGPPTRTDALLPRPQAFQELWSQYDPTATSYINVGELKGFLLELPTPLGLHGWLKYSEGGEPLSAREVRAPGSPGVSPRGLHHRRDALP